MGYQTSHVSLHMPSGSGLSWKLLYNNIKRMRSNLSAPVDTMGCHKCADETAHPKVVDLIQRYQNLVALLLSSQTKDTVTYEAMQRLKQVGLEPQIIVETDRKTIEELIYPVGFYKKKAENLVKLSQLLLDKYNGDIPSNVDELMRLPGIGQKMAYICMNISWGKVTGIGVDTHVHRIAQRLKWVEPSNDPNKTRLQLEKLIPKKLWMEFNPILVGFGQQICTPINPKCDKCLNNDICPKYFENKLNGTRGRRRKADDNFL